MKVLCWFLALTIAIGVAFPDARLLFFATAWLVWTAERLAVRAPGFGGLARALLAPALPVALVVGLGIPSVRDRFAARDAFAEQVKGLAEAKLHDGTFVAEAEGLRGPVRLAVEIRQGKIFDVRVLSASETISVGGNALETLRAETLDTGRPPERLVTGATHSSQGYRDALNRALVASAYGVPETAWYARVYYFVTRNRLRFSLLNEVVLYLVGAAALAGFLGRLGGASRAGR